MRQDVLFFSESAMLNFSDFRETLAQGIGEGGNFKLIFHMLNTIGKMQILHIRYKKIACGAKNKNNISPNCAYMTGVL